METIYNKVMQPVRRSRNLRGIREHVSATPVAMIRINDIANGCGYLYVDFANGDLYETTFASFTVLKEFVRRWRNVYGAPITVNGKLSGFVEWSNNSLQ